MKEKHINRSSLQIWLALLVAAGVAGGALATEPASPERLPGLAGHGFGDAHFGAYESPAPISSLAFALDSKQFRGACPTNAGWSMAVFGELRIDRPGVYAFKRENGSLAECWIGDRHVDLDKGGSVELAPGWTPLRLYVRSSEEAPLGRLTMNIKWREPGSFVFRPIPADRIGHRPEDENRKAIYKSWIPLVEPRRPLYNRHVFTVDVPKAGFYEYVSGMTWARSYQVWLDGLQAYYRPYRALPDTSDARRGPFGEYRFVRYLTQGKHEFVVYTYHSPFPWNDETGKLLARYSPRLGLLGPDSPAARFTVTPKDREDLVFRKGEPLVLRFEQATDAETRYRIDVRRQRTDDPIVWSGFASLRAKAEHAVADVAYPCDQEGAFEYTVTDEGGSQVDGPWEFVVVDPTPLPTPKERGQAEVQPILVDTVDCTNTNDPLHEFRDNGTSSVVEGPAGKYRVTGTNMMQWVTYLQTNGVWRLPEKGEQAPKWNEPGTKTFTKLSWFAFTLRVKNPGRQHVVVAWIPNDAPRSVPVQVYDQVSGQYNADSLWAGLAPEAGAFSPLFIPVWPNGDLDVMMLTDGVQRGARYRHLDMAPTEGAVARLELYEYPDGLPPLPEPAEGWGKNKDFTWVGEQWNLSMEQRMMPKLWQDGRMRPAVFKVTHHFADGFYDWKALLDTWERYGQFARWRGESVSSVPVYTYGNTRMINTPHFPVFHEAFSSGWGSRTIDPFFRDQFKLMLLVAEKYGLKLVMDAMVQVVRPEYLLTFDPSWTGDTNGVFLTDFTGKPPAGWATAFNPAHPVSRRYFLAMAEDVAKQYGKYPAFGGLRTRQWGPLLGFDGWFSNLKTAYDDFTVGLFAKETGVDVPIPDDDPNRFKLRYDWLMQNASNEWVQWRCDKTFSLREELLATVRRYAPTARLYGATKPYTTAGGVDLRRVKDRHELGWSGARSFGGDGVENTCHDPIGFKNFDRRFPEAQRPTDQELLGGFVYYPSDFCSGAFGALRSAPYHLKEMAQALSDENYDTLEYGGCWVTGHAEESLRRFIQAWRAIPDLKFDKIASPTRESDPVAGWEARDGKTLVFYLINRTDKIRTVKVGFQGASSGARDRVTGETIGAGQQVDIVLLPHMLKVFSAPGAKGIREVTARDP
ncbi:MAG: hypothetical protein PHR35_04635 [Kiritimatiellae bacterium]|nr:hypothetical protein [Kiritimatiellia bacterium]